MLVTHAKHEGKQPRWPERSATTE